jgi:hypothetical protein
VKALAAQKTFNIAFGEERQVDHTPDEYGDYSSQAPSVNLPLEEIVRSIPKVTLMLSWLMLSNTYFSNLLSKISKEDTIPFFPIQGYFYTKIASNKLFF